MHVNRNHFSHWAPGALDETIVQAEKFLAVHGGNFDKALRAIADLAGGNVSLQCRAHFGPIERVLQSARPIPTPEYVEEQQARAERANPGGLIAR